MPKLLSLTSHVHANEACAQDCSIGDASLFLPLLRFNHPQLNPVWISLRCMGFAMQLHQPFKLWYAGAAAGAAFELGLQRGQICPLLAGFDNLVF